MKGKYKTNKNLLLRIVRELGVYNEPPFCKLLNNGKILIWNNYNDSDVWISEILYPLSKYWNNIYEINDNEIKELLKRKENELLLDGDINKAINRDIVDVQGQKIKYVRYDYHCQKILCEGILDKYSTYLNFNDECSLHNNKKYFLVLILKGIVGVGCTCGYIKVWNIDYIKCYGHFLNDKCRPEKVYSMIRIKDRIIAVGNSNNIKIWEIFDSHLQYKPKCLMMLYGQTATTLQYEPKGNILFAGGKDGSVKCYLLDSSLKGQWFLNFHVENEEDAIDEDDIISDSSDEDDEVSDRYGDSPKNEPAHKVSITVNQLFILPNGIITGLIKKGEVFRFINFPSLTPSLKLN